ncbi:hypothetical protein BB560_003325 [Smittium megazygosporum]|uniref:Proteasome assembly chaperone 2 n=1 Tax=Smittium megazygosporum TaxID=133381 RepID=A0A2T9ZCA5_9FUNG|nr:hypothetical protein BB560_003325 [Smittium megazygosporum]
MSAIDPVTGSRSFSFSFSFIGSIANWPTVSIGNVPQLAIDLVVSTAKLLRIGSIESPHVYSITGESSYEHCKEYPTAPIEGHRKQLALQILDFFKQNNFKNLIVLSSSNASFVDDSVLSGSRSTSFSVGLEHKSTFISYLESCGISNKALSFRENSKLASSDFSKLKISEELQSNINENPEFVESLNTNLTSNSILKQTLESVHDTGILKHLITCCINQHIPMDALVMFVNEGDNIPEAILFANLLNSALNILDISQAQSN